MMNEKTPILRDPSLCDEPQYMPSKRRAILHLSNISLALTLVVIATFYWWSSAILRWSLIVLLAFLFVFFLLTVHGMYVWFCDAEKSVFEAVDASKYDDGIMDGGKFVTTSQPTTRSIHYHCWGSNEPDAVTVVVCHGSCLTGKYLNQVMYPDPILKELNVRAIAPSYPGHGLSDMQPFRSITDWPNDDLLPILEAEGVTRFMIHGMSYGTAHAMAAASYFGPDRCIGLGLNVPYLPRDVCQEFGFPTDQDKILNGAWFQSPNMAPIISLIRLCWGLMWKNIGSMLPAIVSAENPAAICALEKDCRQCAIRGHVGQAYEMLNGDTNQVWPDPRGIEIKYVAVWYAEDDSLCPPEHGKWLAELFVSKPGVQTSIRSERTGWGHMTYTTEKDCDNAVMTRAMLDLLKK